MRSTEEGLSALANELVDPEASDLPAPVPSPAAPGRKLLLGASLILIAFSLRSLFGSLSVLLPEVMESTGLSPLGASLLTTLPILCLGLFAFPAPALSRRIGTERALLVALVLVCIGTLLRGTGSLPVLFAASALAGAGIAIGNVLLPGLVKRDFADRAAMMTGLYTVAICAGASITAATTVPLERSLFGGDWAAALAFWALPSALVIVLWAPQAWAARPAARRAGRSAGGLFRDRLAWQVTGFMGLQSALAYVVMGWLAPILRERGLDGTTAGYVVAVSIMAQLATCLFVPSVAARCRNQRGLAVGLSALILASMLAFLFAPLGGCWAWAVLLGCGQGGAFALALSLIVMRSSDSATAAQLSAMAQGVGYILATTGPLVAGLLRGWTGSFTASSWLFAVLATGMACCGWGAGRALFVRTGRAP